MSSILSRVVQLQVAPRGLRKANAVKVQRAKANNLDSMSSILSRVVQLQVAPRGLRKANAVKVEIVNIILKE